VSWLIVTGLVLLAGLALYWLLITTEGTYLGPKVVALLYNGVAQRYDRIKEFDPQLEETFLTRPLLRALRDRPSPLVLDVATGTGRIPALLLGAAAFDGRVIGLDYARKMLAVATEKTAGYPGRVAFIWQDTTQLPFPDASFDLVTCLEALEFMPRPKQALAEIVRVARPGGLVFVTRRRSWERKVMPGKSWSKEEFRTLMGTLDLQKVHVIPWQLDYDLAWGWKPAAGASPLHPSRGWWNEGLLCCPTCGARTLAMDGSTLRCSACHSCCPIAADGVIELAGVRKRLTRSAPRWISPE